MKFIVIYGINNIGKSTQIKNILNYLKSKNLKVEHLKYPVYNLEPTGPKINKILRSKEQKISEEELQNLYTQNRKDYEPILIKKLNKGIYIVAEDYRYTGIAWGSAKGANEELLKKQNKNLLKEELVILMDGKRFLCGKEAIHIHENNDSLMQKVRLKLLEFAKEQNWNIINANQPKDKVFQDIKQILDNNI